MKKLLIILIAAVSISVFTVESFSQMRRSPEGGRGMGGMHDEGWGDGHNLFADREFLKDKMKFSDDQIKKVDKINADHKDNMLKYSSMIKSKKEDLRKLLLEPKVDLVKVKSVLKDIADIEVEIRVLMIEQRIAIEEVLTPDQKKMLKKRRMGMGKRGL